MNRFCRSLFLMVLVLPWMTGCASFDEWQRTKVYRPTPVDPAAWPAELAKYPGVAAQTLMLPSGEQIQLLRFAGTGREGRTAPVNVLYLHGTLRHALQNSQKIEGITRNGLDVLAPDYRGWGASSYRVPDEASLQDDAWAAWQEARKTPGPWVIFGHSMGSGLAVGLAQRIREAREQDQASGGASDYCALVLESAFTSFDDVARSVGDFIGPIAAAVSSQKMASIDRIGLLHGPIWMLHGNRDATIPVALGKKLFAAAPSPKYWLDLPKDHSDLQTDTTGAYDAVWQQVKSSCQQTAAKP